MSTICKLYQSCDDIPLYLFIEVQKGNLAALVIEGKATEAELSAAAGNLIEEYCRITGSRGITNEISTRNDILNLNTRIIVLESLKLMIGGKMYEEARVVAKSVRMAFPSDITEDSLQNFGRLVDAEIGNRRYMLKRKESQLEQSDGGKEEKDFTRERMIVSAHFKMHIDAHVITAAEYGNLVSLMLNELKRKKDGK